jgi:hypothetical protein
MDKNKKKCLKKDLAEDLQKLKFFSCRKTIKELQEMAQA